MKLKATIKKVDGWWAVESPELLIHTQGKTKVEAAEMLKDAVEGVVDRKGFKVRIIPSVHPDTLIIYSLDSSALMAAVLRQQRAHRGLSLRDVAKRLNSNSPTSVGRYEKGTKLTAEKFSEILAAIEPDFDAVLTLERKHG